MPRTRTHKPAEVFPPGEFIREELEARQWTQADLAQVTHPATLSPPGREANHR